MQLKDQWKRPRDWKVIAGAGAVAALGVTGLVLANPADSSAPDAISLDDRTPLTATPVPAPLPPTAVIDLSDLADDDSPFGGTGTAKAATNSDAPSETSPAPAIGGGDDDGDEDPDASPAPAGGGDDTADASPAPAGGGDDTADASPAPAGGGDDTADASAGS